MTNYDECATSDTTGKTYKIADAVRIINMQQLAAYLEHGAELLDIYSSRDFKTNKPILVGIVSRHATKELYNRWCNHELN